MKIAFVTPWFGMDIPGGAEAEAREVGSRLQKQGQDVEVLTTCVKEFRSDWSENYYKEGEYKENGIVVRRFKADSRNKKAFDEINYKLMNHLPVSYDEEEIFLKNMVNSCALCDYIEKEKENYSLFVFIPYMFGTTYYGCRICPEKSVLIPCFHDEAYFYMEHFKDAFSKVAGIVYNAEPEKTLTEKIYPLAYNIKQIVMGIGMDINQTGDANRFRKKYQIEYPFVLYAGRKDKGKNVDTLLDYFDEFKRRNRNKKEFKLVLIGGGEIEVPKTLTDDVIDLGFVDIQDKYDAYAAATVLCQPSKHESFSFVIMESWLASRPVMVANQCEVTKNFARESNGGLYFKDYFEFEGTLNYLLEHPTMADEMGRNGRTYVLSHFGWDVIVDKYCKFFNKIINEED